MEDIWKRIPLPLGDFCEVIEKIFILTAIEFPIFLEPLQRHEMPKVDLFLI